MLESGELVLAASTSRSLREPVQACLGPEANDTPIGSRVNAAVPGMRLCYNGEAMMSKALLHIRAGWCRPWRPVFPKSGL